VRRIIALRTRPRWMIAVTCMALIAALAAGWLALEARRDMAAAIEDRNHAIDARASAQAQAHEAEAASDRLTHEVSELEAKIEAAIQRGITEQSDADRRRSLDQLRRLQRQRAEVVARQRQAERDRQNTERRAPLVVPAACRDNAICQ
jgi:tRNA uridine 5-carbamoylmethylation protein Kti12